MNKNRLKFHVAGMALMMGILLVVHTNNFAQSMTEGTVASAKTKSGSVTYFLAPRGGYDIDIFSKEAGEPSDFAGVVQRCTASKKQVVFAVNGAKCDKALKPLGLLIKGLAEYKKFAWPDKNIFGLVDPSGVFAIDRNNGVYGIPGKEFKADNALATYQLAIQSGPVLLTKGFLNPGITRSVSAELRSGIGVKANGDVLVAISDDKMSLREFALFFQDADCKFAMVLDEGGNCQWYAPGKQKRAGKQGEVIVVTKK